MSVPISKLKQKEIREIVSFIDDDGNNQEIIIKNISKDQKEEFKDFLKEKVNLDSTELLIRGNEIVRFFYTKLTDLDIESEDDIMDILNSPNYILTKVSSVIGEIITELVYEITLEKKLEMNNMLILLEQQECYNQIEEILNKTNDNDEDNN
ncbi:hypothetical protein [Clostridium sp. Marseille-QA1073]